MHELETATEVQELFDRWATLRANYEAMGPDFPPQSLTEMNNLLLEIRRRARPLIALAESYGVDATALSVFCYELVGGENRDRRADVRAVFSRLCGALLRSVRERQNADALNPLAGVFRGEIPPCAQRIQHLRLPDDVKPVLIEAAGFVLTHPELFASAAKAIDVHIGQIERESRAAGDPFSDVYSLQDLLVGVSTSEPPSLNGESYTAWTRQLILLTTLATCPCDLSSFGRCGAIPWDNSILQAPLSARDPEVMMSFPKPGRASLVFDIAKNDICPGEMNEEMRDRADESVIEHYNQIIDGKHVPHATERRSRSDRGPLRKLVDRLRRILVELTPTAATAPARQEPADLIEDAFREWADIQARRPSAEPLSFDELSAIDRAEADWESRWFYRHPPDGAAFYFRVEARKRELQRGMEVERQLGNADTPSAHLLGELRETAERADGFRVKARPPVPDDNVTMKQAYAWLDRLQIAMRHRTRPQDGIDADALDRLADAFRRGITPDSTATAPAATAKLTEPSERAFAAYRAHRIMGKTQTHVAQKLSVNQGQVSRWVEQVAGWIAAGNVLPDLPGITTKPVSIDPTVIETGERLDHRTKRQRSRQSDEE